MPAAEFLKYSASIKLDSYMVVFSHGFGSQKEAGGLFTDICAALPDGFGYALFNYYEYDEVQNFVTITTFKEQQKRLTEILGWLEQRPEVEKISVVGHSMGCITVALARHSSFEHVVFLAPPLTIGSRTREYFTKRQGAKKEGNIWIVPRSDGSVSKIPEKLFVEFETINALDVLTDFAKLKNFTLISAGQDEVLPTNEYQPLQNMEGIHHILLSNARHNFENADRPELVREVMLCLEH